jgi:hypothetical protein
VLRVAVIVGIVGLPAVVFPTAAWAVTNVSIGNGTQQGNGSYINAQQMSDALTITSVNIFAAGSITIVDPIDLSASALGTPHFNVHLTAPTINIDFNMNMATAGGLVLSATTLNLSDTVTSGGSLIHPSRVFTTATQVNVLSDTASVQQAIDFSSPTLPGVVQVSAGNHAENVTINHAVTLTGNDGTADAGADPAAPTIVGTQAGGQVVSVAANGVTIDGLHLNGTVAGGASAASTNGISASGVNDLTVRHNTFDGFSGPSIATPRSTNVVTDANLITPTLLGIDVTPSTPTVIAGADQQFSATGTYSEGPTADLTGTATWSSSDESVADVNTSGLAHGLIGGTTTISASLGTISGQTLVTVAPDTTPPQITLVTPPEGASYTHNDVVDADYSCQDESGGSGLASCVGDVAGGAPIDTSSLGPHTFTVNATDHAGNPTQVVHDYTVVAPPPTVPDAPTIGTATRGNGSASVSWTAPANNGGSAISGYTVTASPGGASATVDGSQTSATVTGLTNGTSYTLTVTATNGVGTGPSSGPSNSFVPATVPGVPTIGTFVVTGTTGSVAFTAPASNGGSPITGYTATCTSNNLGMTRTGTRTVSPISVLSLTSGKTYTCKVRATNAVGTGLASAASAAKTVPVVPGAPTNVAAVPGSSQASVSWKAPATNGGSPLTGYVVMPYIGPVAQTLLVKSVGPSVLSASLIGLSNGTSYTFRVAAKNLLGSGLAAVSLPVVVGAPVAPVVTAVGSSTSAAVSWTAPANNGSAVTSYVVRTYLGAVLQSAKTHTLTCTPQPCSPARTWTVTGLTNGSVYTFKVVATNTRGTGPAGATTIKVGVPTLPGVPTSVHATGGVGSATVSWVAPANGSATITAYIITPYKAGVAQPVITVAGTLTTRTITGLTTGQSYTFKITARNAVGTGTQSAASNAVAPT